MRGQASPADLGAPRRQRCFGGVGGPIREAIVKESDKDGDGKLNEEERAAARKAMEARRANRPAKERLRQR